MLFSQNAKALKAKKEEGNKAFKEGNFEAAYELYSEALTIDPNNIKTNAKLYCNRATVGSKVRNMHREMLAPTPDIVFHYEWMFTSTVMAISEHTESRTLEKIISGIYIPVMWEKKVTVLDNTFT